MFLLITFLRFGVFLEVASVETHVPVEGRDVLELAMAQVALDGFLVRLGQSLGGAAGGLRRTVRTTIAIRRLRYGNCSVRRRTTAGAAARVERCRTGNNCSRNLVLAQLKLSVERERERK